MFMQDTLYRSQRILFGLLLGIAGLYAGVLLMYSIGVSPVLDSMSGDDFLRAWQTHDFFLHIRIRILLASFGILYVLALLFLAKMWRSKTFFLIVLAFLLSAADIYIARSLQRPVNRENSPGRRGDTRKGTGLCLGAASLSCAAPASRLLDCRFRRPGRRGNAAARPR